MRQQAPPQVLPALRGKGPRAQRSVAADLIFGSFDQAKEQSLPAAIERVRVYIENDVSVCSNKYRLVKPLPAPPGGGNRTSLRSLV